MNDKEMLEALYEAMLEGEHELKNDKSMDVVRKTMLPKKMKPEKEVWEELGFIFTEVPGDDIMYKAILPNGWNIRGTESPMWNEIIDENDMIRGTLFYYPASYDRNAFMFLEEKQKETNIEHAKNR